MRFFATVLDGIIVTGVIAAVIVFLLSAEPPASPIKQALLELRNASRMGAWAGLSSHARMGLCLSMLLSLLYSSTEAFFGTSPAKFLLGMRIRLDDGSPAPSSVLVLRFLAKNLQMILEIAALYLVIPALGSIAVAAGAVITLGFLLTLTNSRQALHDRLAGTAVYSLRPDVEPPPKKIQQTYFGARREPSSSRAKAVDQILFK